MDEPVRFVAVDPRLWVPILVVVLLLVSIGLWKLAQLVWALFG